MAEGPIVGCPSCGKRNRVPVAARGVPRCGSCRSSLPWIVDAAPDAFEAAIDATVPVVVDFWAPWCAPCRMVSPALEALAGERAGRLKLVKLNVDTAPQLGARYGVQGIPLLVLLRDGREVDRLVGAAPLPRLRAWLEHGLSSTT